MRLYRTRINRMIYTIGNDSSTSFSLKGVCYGNSCSVHLTNYQNSMRYQHLHYLGFTIRILRVESGEFR